MTDTIEKPPANLFDTMLAGDMHDIAHDVWSLLHSDIDLDAVGHHPCKLCGETMYPCMDYTHAPDCPYEVMTSAIDAFDEAVKKAATATPGETVTP